MPGGFLAANIVLVSMRKPVSWNKVKCGRGGLLECSLAFPAYIPAHTHTHTHTHTHIHACMTAHHHYQKYKDKRVYMEA